MEAVIKQQLNGTTAEEVRSMASSMPAECCAHVISFLQLVEVTVEGVPCTKIEGLNDTFTSLARLSVVNCGLKSLDGLPKLPKLTTVEYPTLSSADDDSGCGLPAAAAG